MTTPKGAGHGSTGIWVLNPKYVVAKAAQSRTIARASWLLRLADESGFGADVRVVDDSDDHLRGVRRVVAAEGVAAAQDLELRGDYGCMYTAMVANPNDALSVLSRLAEHGTPATKREILDMYQAIRTIRGDLKT